MKLFQRLSAIIAAALLLAACASGQPTNTGAANETTQVRRGDLLVTVSSSGTVEPEQSADLTFGATGTVQRVFVTEGQQVKQGQELGALDPSDLDQQVRQAEANLQTARARLEQAKSGNATDQDRAAQEASVAAAQAQLDKARTGGATAADVANAEAAVRGAQAQLSKARTGGVTAADIANAEAAVRGAEAALDRAKTGNVTAADIAGAEAQVRSAEAALAKVQQGATTEQISAARARLDQATQTYQKTAAAASANKSQAEQALSQAADSVRLAQEAYSAAYWDNEQAQNGIDPKTGARFEDEKLDEDIQQEQYAQALRNAELQLSQAQSQLEQARITADNAKQQEINDVASAQSAVDDAQTQLDELLKGPKPADVTQAQAAVDQARAQLQKLQQGGSPADVASAQAQLDQARAQLQKLRQGGSASDIAAARAQVDQANAQLQKLRQGGSASDIAAAQAQVDQAQAQFDKLTAGASATDISIAEAGVSQAEAQLEAAKLSRDKATLKAPFNGIVTAVNVGVGDAGASAAGGAAFTIVDPTKLHINVNISESDVAQVKDGAQTQITIDALGTDVVSGTVSYIAPAATVVQDVTTYRVRIDLPQNNPAIRVGMTASVEISTARKTNVLIIPTSAIRSSGSRRFVRIRQGETFVEREIKIGLSNDVDAEVLSGLNEGDEIATLATTATEQ